jgi:hypothetical protein
LLPLRANLSTKDVDLAAAVWQAYCSPDPRLFNEWAYALSSGRLPFLKHMAQQHRELFPHVSNGLNRIEQRLLEGIGQAHPDRRKLIGSWLQQDRDYGFGDMQVEIFLRGIESLFEEHTLRLTAKGVEVMEGRTLFRHPDEDTLYNGGALARDYLWTGKELIRA